MESFPNIENWEEIQNLRALSSIDFTIELLKEAPFELEIEGHGDDKFVKTRIDEKRLLAFAEGRKDRLAEDERRMNLMEEKTELNLTPELSDQVNVILSEVENLAMEAGLFSKRFIERRDEFKLKTEIVDSEKSFQGWFMCQELLEFSEEEEKMSELRVGLKGTRRFASDLRMRAAEAGIILDKEMSLLLTLVGTIGHEYGHYIEHVISSGPNFTTDSRLSESADSVNPLDIKLDDDREERGIISERFSQSLASMVLERKIESMNISPDQKNKLRRLALGTDPGEVEKYRTVLDWANEKSLSIKHLCHVLLDLHIFLQKKGLEEESQKCMTQLRYLGYYTEPYTAQDLRVIVESVE